MTEQTLVYQILCKQSVVHLLATDTRFPRAGLDGHHGKMHLSEDVSLRNICHDDLYSKFDAKIQKLLSRVKGVFPL